jgi:hypothetical protein
MGSLFSAISGSSKKAAKAQTTAAEQANNVAGEERNASIANYQPYLDSGKAANSELNTYLGLPSGDTTSADYGSLLKPFTGEDLTSTPGYQFQLQQGQQALDRKQASGGNYLSGAALKEGQRFAQGLAGTSFQAGYDRNAQDKSRVQNFLSSVAQLGQASAGNVANIRQNFSNAFGQNTIGAGNAQAAGIIGQSNAIGGAINTGLGLGAGIAGANGMLGSGVQNMLGAGTPSSSSSAPSYNSGSGLTASAYAAPGSIFGSPLGSSGGGASSLSGIANMLPFFAA